MNKLTRKHLAIAAAVFGIAGCVGEGFQGFNLARSDGALALCGSVVPASMLTS